MVEDKEGQGEPEATSEKTEPTIEELGKQLAELQETSQKMEDNWKKQEVVSSRKEQTIQQLREQVSSNDSQSDMNKVLIAMMASQRNQSTEELEGEIKTKQPDLLKQYEQIVEQSDKKRKLDLAMNQIKTVQERADGLGVQGEEYDIVRAFAEAGQYDKANKRLDKLEEAKQTPPPEEKKESDDDRVERLANEKAKAMLEKKGVLTQDAGTPSASGSLSGMDVGDLKEKMSDPVWFKEHEEEIDKLYKGGKFFNK